MQELKYAELKNQQTADGYELELLLFFIDL